MTWSSKRIAKAVALTELPGVGHSRAIELLEEFGDPQSVFAASKGALADYHYIDDTTYNQLQNLDPTVTELQNRFEQCREEGIHLIPVLDDRYPEQLQSISGPILLYARGNVDLLDAKMGVGFTGTRDASDEAVEWTQEVANTLADEGRVIISGGATGIDTAAHKGALNAGGDTIVVLGTGINVAYPEENEFLFTEIVNRGGLLLSQRPPNAKPSRAGFLNRNATLTGLSHSVAVVATDGTGGTMSTYNDARSQGRSIFCPDPDLELAPVEGIKKIARADAIPIRRGEEILAYQDSEKESEANGSKSSNPAKDAQQASMDEFL